jgi:hypothetical protein
MGLVLNMAALYVGMNLFIKNSIYSSYRILLDIFPARYLFLDISTINLCRTSSASYPQYLYSQSLYLFKEP